MKITSIDVMRIAYAHIMLGVDQHILAAMWSENQGRVNEICKVFEYAMHNHMLIYRQLTEKPLGPGRRQEDGPTAFEVVFGETGEEVASDSP
jgi:hypothetical protein